ncbi:unnamed protein product, partial [Meganyctiphanes norvegica]
GSHGAAAAALNDAVQMLLQNELNQLLYTSLPGHLTHSDVENSLYIPQHPADESYLSLTDDTRYTANFKVKSNNGPLNVMVNNLNGRQGSEDVKPPSVVHHHIGKREAPGVLFRRPGAPRPCSEQAGNSASSVFSGANAFTYISFIANSIAMVLNINNNINNNNNNNNVNSNTNIDNSNTNFAINSNNANQINIMPPGGKRKKRHSQTSSSPGKL